MKTRPFLAPALFAAALLAWHAALPAADVFYSGRALGFHGDVNFGSVTKKVTLAKNDMSCQGVPDEETVLGVENAPPLGFKARTITTFTQGVDGVATARAATQDVLIDVPGLQVAAEALDAFAEVRCVNGAPTASGSANIVAVTINGERHELTSEPNQTIEIPDVARLVFNQQALFQRAVRIRALHVTLFNADAPANGEIRISEATAKINSCAAVCTPE